MAFFTSLRLGALQLELVKVDRFLLLGVKFNVSRWAGVGQALKLLPPPQELFANMNFSAVVLDVSMELLFPVKIPSFHALEAKWFD